MKKIVFVHGLNSGPNDGWFPWLKENLQDRGFEVVSSQFPKGKDLKSSKWIEHLKSDSGTLDEDLFFVGHSLGCVSIVRFLETLPEDIKVGGAVFVAPFFKKLKYPEIIEFTESSLDVEKARKHLLKSISIISEDDHVVPVDVAIDFVNRMNSEVVVDNGKGHFGQKSGIKKLQSALEAVLKITK